MYEWILIIAMYNFSQKVAMANELACVKAMQEVYKVNDTIWKKDDSLQKVTNR
jgi:hypothetical protein